MTEIVERPGDVTEALQEAGKPDSEHTPTRYLFAELLTVLGHADDYRHDQVAVCWDRPGRKPFTSELHTVETAPRFVEQLLAQTGGTVNVWFGVNPVNSHVTRGRGTVKDIARIAALYADVDVKPGACPDLETGYGVIEDLSVVLGHRPAAIIHSGHGLQPIWPVDRESAEKLTNPESQKLARRFGRLVADIADKRHVALDNVSDLTRVLRVPDTMNVKDPEHPAPTRCEADTGTALTAEDIAQALDEYGLPEIQSDAAFTGAMISAPDGWEFGDSDCQYVVNMVVPWGEESDKPRGGRHQWAMNKAVRLAAAHRLGCITEDGLRASVEHLAQCLEHWCNTVGDPRDLQPDEIDGAYRWATEKVSTLTDEQTRKELGNHEHQSNDVDTAAPADRAPLLYTDVAGLLDGGLPEAPRPGVLKRVDGVPLFYRGEVNILFGDPEHGKTWVGLAACAQVLQAGGRVLVADLDHNGAPAIISRLLLLGAPVEALRDPEQFRHCAPVEVARVMQMVDDCTAWCPEVILVDSTGELLPMFSASSDNGDDFTRVHNRVLQPLAATGGAVLLVDHLAKGKESRDIGPGGTMAKRRTVGGLSLRVVREHPYTKTGGGRSRLLVNKDRHGGVRDHCTAARPRDNGEQLAGTFTLDPTDGDVARWRITPESDSATTGEFRPTGLMEKASRVIEAHPGELTRDKIAKQAGGRKRHSLNAIDLLVSEGFVTKSSDRYPRYTTLRPYLQSEDPNSEQHLELGDRLRRHADGEVQGDD
ncbi:AAA family ATPase [Mycolicibacterium hippocampi]|nr:AAA family ATPase [Mycolicibacterium hippocampi]